MFRIAGAISAAVLVCALLESCTPDGGATTPPDNIAATVGTRGMVFSPASVTIKVGQTVRWSNNDITSHTVTSGNPGDADAGSLFDANPPLLPGRSFDHTFGQAGTFKYFCRIHSTMMRDAEVIVQP